MNLLPVAILGGAAWYLSRPRRNPSTHKAAVEQFTNATIGTPIIPTSEVKLTAAQQSRLKFDRQQFEGLPPPSLERKFQYLQEGYAEASIEEMSDNVAYWEQKLIDLQEVWRRRQPMREAAAYARQGGR